jgi:hypothetical protein
LNENVHFLGVLVLLYITKNLCSPDKYRLNSYDTFKTRTKEVTNGL